MTEKNPALTKKQAEEALRESERRYRELVQNANSAILRWRSDGTITFFNEYAQTFFGYSEDEVIGRPVSILVPETESTGADLTALAQDIVSHPEQYVQNINENIRRNGRRAWMVWTNKPVFDKNGRVTEILAVGTDITERKLSEDSLRQQNMILEGINRILQEALTCDTSEQLGKLCLSVAEYLTQSKFGFIAEIVQDSLLHPIAISDPGWELCTMYDQIGHRRQLGDFKLHGLYGRVLTDGLSLIANDPSSHPDSIGIPLGHPSLTSFLGVPLIHGGKVIGMIAMGNREGGYAQEQQYALEAIGPVVVEALLHKRTEQKLRENEERFSLVFQKAPFPISLTRARDGILVDVNDAWIETFGFTRTEVTGKTPVELGISRDPGEQARLYAVLQEKGSVRSEEVTGYRTKTNPAPVILASLEMMEFGGEKYMFTLAQDITERKRAEAALHQALARAEEGDHLLSALMEYVPEGITMTDASLRLLRVSRHGLELLGGRQEGRSVDEVAAQWKVYHADGKTPMAVEDLPLVRAVQRREVVRDLEIVQINARGDHLPLLCTAGPIRDAAGGIIGGIVVWRDITARKQAVEALRQLSHFPEENPNPVLRCTPGGAILYANTPARRWLAALDWRTGGLLPEPVHAAMAATRGQNHAVQTEINDPSGRILSISAVQPSGAEYINLYGTDITELKRAGELVKASLEEKEALLKEIHHRVKNNMQVISSLVDLQAGESRDAAVRDFLKDVTLRVRSMAMVHEKLYQSRDLAHIEFAEYAKSLLGHLWRAQVTVSSGIRLDLALEPVSLPVNLAVPCGLILNELINNALTHAFRGLTGGEVTVSLGCDAEGRVRLGVCDNGLGLPAGFDWRQARSLGLRLVQMLSGQLHAEVEVSSEGEGTRFEIAFKHPAS